MSETFKVKAYQIIYVYVVKLLVQFITYMKKFYKCFCYMLHNFSGLVWNTKHVKVLQMETYSLYGIHTHAQTHQHTHTHARTHARTHTHTYIIYYYNNTPTCGTTLNKSSD